jgi:hypothetical protein
VTLILLTSHMFARAPCCYRLWEVKTIFAKCLTVSKVLSGRQTHTLTHPPTHTHTHTPNMTICLPKQFLCSMIILSLIIFQIAYSVHFGWVVVPLPHDPWLLRASYHIPSIPNRHGGNITRHCVISATSREAFELVTA